MMLGQSMYEMLKTLFPICRSITGDGVRQTLRILSEVCPMTIHEVPTGTKAFDWTVPEEWNIRDAYIEDESGSKVVDFRKSNLHVVGYSTPVNTYLSLYALQQHLHSLPNQPDAIPYVTSYYEKTWGFCLPHNERMKLKDGFYHAVIDSTLKPGSMTYGECIIKGHTSFREVFLSTYVCHPSMANNELSGPVVTAYIGKWLASQPLRYTYRIVFIPETIGALVYLSKHTYEMKTNIMAGFNLSCIGDEREYSYVSSRNGRTLADRVVENVLHFQHPGFKKYSFLDRGSDERQYCSPGINLPVVTLCRSKYGTYPEYHTSLDNLDFVTPRGLQGGYNLVKDCIDVIENNHFFYATNCGEPQLGRRGLYPNLSMKGANGSFDTMMDFLSYADGQTDLVNISNTIGKSVFEILPIAKKLKMEGLIGEAVR